MSPAAWKAAGALALVVLGAGSAWQVQGWRYSAKLSEQSRSHTDTLNQLAMVGAAAQKGEQDKRLTLEQKLSASDQSHNETLTNAQNTKLACAIALPLLISGCQSSSPRVQPVAVQCLPPPAPAAWFMAPYEPNLTQRMLNELSASPTKVTGG